MQAAGLRGGGREGPGACLHRPRSGLGGFPAEGVSLGGGRQIQGILLQGACANRSASTAAVAGAIPVRGGRRAMLPQGSAVRAAVAVAGIVIVLLLRVVAAMRLQRSPGA
jgi:hypothetical protein